MSSLNGTRLKVCVCVGALNEWDLLGRRMYLQGLCQFLGLQMWKYVWQHMQTLRSIKFNGGLTGGRLEVNPRGGTPINESLSHWVIESWLCPAVRQQSRNSHFFLTFIYILYRLVELRAAWVWFSRVERKSPLTGQKSVFPAVQTDDICRPVNCLPRPRRWTACSNPGRADCPR